MRLLNGLVQINVTPMHQYEKIILVEPMKVFCRYFIEQSKKIMEEKETQEKEDDIKDIEEAICSVASIYENVINGASNADKRMFMSMPINSTLYNVFPKLYAFYEGIISKIAALYSDENNRSRQKQSDYAFLLNPTIRNQLYTEVLFKRRKESGKVVIINMPVQLLEKGDDLLLYLTHEVFHVLTKKERQRKRRAGYLLANLIQQLGIQIFNGVVFSNEENEDDQIKAIILDTLMGTLEEEYQKEIEGKNDHDQFFYSANIMDYFRNLVVKQLHDDLITWPGILYKRLFEELYLSEETSQKKYFEENIAYLQEKMEKIQSNILAIILNGEVSYILGRLMYLYRECYADLACIWTSGYEISHYKKAFSESVRFKITDEQMKEDDYHKLRQVLVEKALEENEESDGLDDQLSEQQGQGV